MRLTAMLAVFALATGCSTEGKPSPKADTKADTKVEAAAPAAEAPNAEGPAVAKAELSEADKALIARDPETMTPDERRERAQALRRKVMLNPNGPTARAIEDMQEAVRDGTMQPPTKDRNYPVLSLPGEKPVSGPPPAGSPREDPPAEAP